MRSWTIIIIRINTAVFTSEMFSFCIDHPECSAGTHKCDQHCHNSHGSYYCTCDFGYTVETDGRTCKGM